LIKKKVYSKKSEFQDILICDSFAYGRMLLLDGLTQVTEADEFIYHEMIVHVPLIIHKNPRKILIIGGGDGGALKQSLLHKSAEITVVEIDKEVPFLCQKYLPKICGQVFKNKRAKIIIGDGFKFIKECKQAFDIIIVDSCDPIGPAKKLFSQEFYQNVFQALKDDGLAVYQSGSLFAQCQEIKQIFFRNKKFFPFVNIYLLDVPSYGEGAYVFTLASKKINPLKVSLNQIRNKFNKISGKTKYYNPEVHLASFVLPQFIKEHLS